jgi:hypothetical protein
VFAVYSSQFAAKIAISNWPLAQHRKTTGLQAAEALGLAEDYSLKTVRRFFANCQSPTAKSDFGLVWL